MLPHRPLVFIGSSSEGLPVAKAIQAELQHCAECVIWHQGLFGLSEGTLDTLVDKLSLFDFAVLALTPDDLVSSRGDQKPAPRDNVLLELGIFIGGLGQNRTYMVVDVSARLKLPSDLAGITYATYQPPNAGTMRSAIGPACTEIEEAIRALGARHVQCPISISGSFFMDATRGYGITLVITNVGEKDFPPYVVNLASQRGTWSIFPSQKRGVLLPEQEREHQCRVMSANGDISPFVGMIGRRVEEINYDGTSPFALQLVLEDSKKVLFEDLEFGTLLVKLIASVTKDPHGASYDGKLEREFFEMLQRKWPKPITPNL